MIALLLFLGLAMLPQTIPNPSFEIGGDRLYAWEAGLPRGYDAGATNIGSYAGRHHAYLFYQARNAADRGSRPYIASMIDARHLRGQRIRVSAAVRLRAAGIGTLTVSPDDRPAGSTNFGNSTWRRVAADVAVPRRAHFIRITFEISPGNDLEVDDVRLEPRG